MEFIIKTHILSHRNICDSKQLLLSLRVSVYHEFRQRTVGIAYLCSMMSGASLGGVKGQDLDHLKFCSLIHLAVDCCQQGTLLRLLFIAPKYGLMI